MYPITDEVAELYKKHYRQVVEITFSGTEETLYLTEENIIQNGLIVDRYVVSGSKIEIGSAIAAQLTLTLNNYDESFNDVVFEGAELYVRIGVKKWDADAWEKAEIHYMPLGYFTVDKTPRKTSQLTLTALDRMAQTDKDVDFDGLTFPCTARALLEYTCNKCLIPLYTDNLDGLPNIDYSIVAAPDTDGLTYRQIIQWIAELTGTCAYIDWNGYLRLTWYVDTNTEITSAERYSGADLYENDITITGVQVTDLDDETYLSGEEGYIFNIEGNSLIQGNYQDIADNLGKVLTGTTYRPYSCTTVPMPWVYPMDYITYVDKKGVSHSTLVTHVEFKLNSSTTIKGVGETATANGYASSNPLTARERLILEKMKASTSKSIDELSTVELQRYNQLLELNQLMANSFGLYMVTVTNDSGTTYYFADAENLENATVIYCFTSGGFAWTTGEGCWNDGKPSFEYGFTSTGNAILNLLSVYKLTADQITANSITATEIDTDTLNVSKILSNETGDITITSNRITITSDYFSLTADGVITATSGKIGGFTIGASSLYNSKTSYKSATEGVYVGTSGIGLGAGTFYVTSAGVLYSTSGTIGGFTLSDSTMKAIVNNYERLVLDADDAEIWFYDGSSSFQSYANLDFNGLGSVWRTSNTKGEEEQTNITQFPYVALDCYARGGLDIYYWYASKELYSHLQVWIDNTTGYLPTIEATGGIGLWIKSDGALDMVGDTEIYGSSPQIYFSASTKGTLSGSWYLGTSTAITSDRNMKNSISELSDEYSALFDGLIPVKFKYNDGTSDRYHTGFIAQETKDAIENAGLTTQDAAMYVEYEDNDGNTACAVRYSEIIALCVNEIQKLKTRVKELENETN